jgi:hypothetical protein
VAGAEMTGSLMRRYDPRSFEHWQHRGCACLANHDPVAKCCDCHIADLLLESCRLLQQKIVIIQELALGELE